eukprot:jgi/Tetstr1/462763/TSEL_007715.t1
MTAEGSRPASRAPRPAISSALDRLAVSSAMGTSGQLGAGAGGATAKEAEVRPARSRKAEQAARPPSRALSVASATIPTGLPSSRGFQTEYRRRFAPSLPPTPRTGRPSNFPASAPTSTTGGMGPSVKVTRTLPHRPGTALPPKAPNAPSAPPRATPLKNDESPGWGGGLARPPSSYGAPPPGERPVTAAIPLSRAANAGRGPASGPRSTTSGGTPPRPLTGLAPASLRPTSSSSAAPTPTSTAPTPARGTGTAPPWTAPRPPPSCNRDPSQSQPQQQQQQQQAAIPQDAMPGKPILASGCTAQPPSETQEEGGVEEETTAVAEAAPPTPSPMSAVVAAVAAVTAVPAAAEPLSAAMLPMPQEEEAQRHSVEVPVAAPQAVSAPAQAGVERGAELDVAAGRRTPIMFGRPCSGRIATPRLPVPAADLSVPPTPAPKVAGRGVVQAEPPEVDLLAYHAPDEVAEDDEPCAIGQAAPMVLNLEDLTQCTPEVLELEIDSLDISQLEELESRLRGDLS